VAVDLFAGNEDRFSARGDIVNKGNIVFQKDKDKRYQPVGVDFFDAQKIEAKMYTPVANPQGWPGMVLADPARITSFGTTAIAALNREFAANMGKHAMPVECILGAEEARRLSHGLTCGADELRMRLLYLRRTRGLPNGTVQRMELLGWQENGNIWVPGGGPGMGPRRAPLMGQRIVPPPQQNHNIPVAPLPNVGLQPGQVNPVPVPILPMQQVQPPVRRQRRGGGMPLAPPKFG
jgi:hypothetical protein